jgi:hypothetical protein
MSRLESCIEEVIRATNELRLEILLCRVEETIELALEKGQIEVAMILAEALNNIRE